MRTALLLALYFLSQILAAQTWHWSQQIGGPGDETAVIAGTDATGAVYLYGRYDSHWNSEAYGLYIGQDTLQEANHSTYLAKFSTDGTLQWLRSCTSIIGIEISNAFLDTVSQKLYVVGGYVNSCSLDTVHLSTGSNVAAFLSQWDLDGQCQWARNVAFSGFDIQRSCDIGAVTVDDQARILIAGHTATLPVNHLAGREVPPGTYASAYNSFGDTLWTRMVATYNGTSRMLDPLEIHTWNGDAFVYNALYMDNASDSLLVGDSVVTGLSGGGYALFRLNSSNGDLGWFTTDGWPQGPADRRSPHLFVLDETGHAFIAGGYGVGVFGTDTLDAPGAGSAGFIARYDTSGTLLWVRGYESIGGTVSLTALSMRPGGGLYAVGSMVGTVNWDGITHTATAFDLMLAVFSESGECLGIDSDVGPAFGSSIVPAYDGIYLAGGFPVSTDWPPYLPITMGNMTYNTFGWKDAFIAKHSFVTSIASQSMGSDGLHIYANPNRGSFQLEMPDAFANERDLVLRIYDSTGRMVLEQPMDMTGEAAHLDVFDAVPGFYNVTLTNGRRSCSGSMVVE